MHSIFAFLFLMLCRFVTQSDNGRCKVNPWSANLEANGYTVTDSNTNRIKKEYFQHKKKDEKDYWKSPNFLNVQCAMTPTMTAKRIFCLHRKQNK